MSAAHRIPLRVVQLGTVLDCVIERAVDGEWQLLTITEWKGWVMASNEAALGAAPGRARLLLLSPKKKVEPPVVPRGSRLYERWHTRGPEKVIGLDVPDKLSQLQGRCLRIGYRSDKWKGRGEHVDYEHDFAERGRLAPLLYTDTADIERARAAVLIGGDMRVTERGLD